MSRAGGLLKVLQPFSFAARNKNTLMRRSAVALNNLKLS